MNGRKLNYVLVQEQRAQIHPFIMSNTHGPCCLFIPCIPRCIDEAFVIRYIVGQVAAIGHVPTRIDWNELDPPEKHYWSAYVHFDLGNCAFVSSTDTFRYQLADGALLDFEVTVVAKENPIPFATLNFDQLAYRLERLTELVHRQDKHIARLERILETFPSPPVLRKNSYLEDVVVLSALEGNSAVDDGVYATQKASVLCDYDENNER